MNRLMQLFSTVLVVVVLVCNPARTWAQTEYIIPVPEDFVVQFGRDVAISKNHVIVSGVITRANVYGVVYIFERDGSAWIQRATITPSFLSDTDFGQSVGISGDYAVIASPLGITPCQVYKREGTDWVKHSEILPGGDQIDISGDLVIINQDDGVAIHRRNGNTWVLEGVLDTDDEWASDVKIFDEVAIVGTGNGKCFVFRKVGDIWEREFWLNSILNEFGRSVSISGNRLMVAAEDRAFIYKYNSGSWTLAADLTAGPSDTNFGEAVAISISHAVVTARHEGGSGSVYFYSPYSFWSITDQAAIEPGIDVRDIPSADMWGRWAIVGVPGDNQAHIFHFPIFIKPLSVGELDIICCIQIPDPGGPVIYGTKVKNRTRKRLRITRWAELTRPDGNVETVLDKEKFVLKPGSSKKEKQRFMVDKSYPAGTYELTLYWNDGRDDVHSSTASFEKLGFPWRWPREVRENKPKHKEE